MNHPESLDQLRRIEELLGISTSDGLEVLDRANREPGWPFANDPDTFEELVRGHWYAIKRQRRLGIS